MAPLANSPKVFHHTRLAPLCIFLLFVAVSVHCNWITPCPEVCKCYTVRMVNPWVRVDCRRARIDAFPKFKKDVVVIFCEETRVRSLLRESFVNASDLGYIDIEHNPINLIEDGALSALEKLQYLKIADSSLTDISSLHDISSLMELELYDNALRNITKDDLANIPYLENLRLDGNLITAFRLPHNYLTHLNLSRNLIREIQEDSFSELTVLKILDLSKNKIAFLKNIFCRSLEVLILVSNEIKEISPSVWQHVPNLDFLDLSNNQINHLYNISHSMRRLNASNNLIEDIKSVEGCQGLTFLDLSKNKLSSLSDIPALPELLVLILDDNNIESIYDLVFEKAPLLATLSLKSNKFTRLSPIANTPSLECLYLSNNSIEYVEAEAFTLSTNLRTIDMGSNKISNLEGFRDFQALNVLNLTRNDISMLHPNDLQNCHQLSILDLSWNIIESLPTFPSMPFLFELYLDFNPIRDPDWSAFDNLNVLKRLSMNGTRITHIPRLINFAALSDISFDGSGVTSVENGAFSSLWNIRSLSIDHHGIQSLSSIGSPFLLFKLQLRFGNLSEIQNDVYLFSLEYFDVTDNRIEIFDIALQSMVRLKYMWADNNLINNLSFLKSMPNIRVLSLRNNRIVHIPVDTFEVCSLLQTVDLSSNLIENIIIGTFDAARQLRGIYLSDNLLRNFSLSPQVYISDDYKDRKRVSTIYLDGNKISSIDSSLTNSSWSIMYLNLANNPLKDIDPHSFNRCPVLKYLNLSGTELEEIPENLFVTTEFLKTLSLNNVTFLRDKKDVSWKLPNVRHMVRLEMKHNNLTEIPDMTDCGILELDLSYNNFSADIWRIMNGTEDLLLMDISQNRVDTLESDFGDRFPNLKTLNASGNRLHRIETNTFDKMKALRSLDLTNNDLKNIPVEAFKDIYIQARVNLTGNRINCDCALRLLLERMRHRMNFYQDIGAEGDITCSEPKRLVGKRIIDTAAEDFLCIPTLDPTKALVYAPTGSTVLLECPLSDPTGVNVTWNILNNGSSPQEVSPRRIITESNRLVIDHMTPSDAGIYQCNATNLQGSRVLNLRLRSGFMRSSLHVSSDNSDRGTALETVMDPSGTGLNKKPLASSSNQALPPLSLVVILSSILLHAAGLI